MARKSSSEHPQTGPLTPAGKERASANSITHGGRCAQHRILPGEDPDEYRALYRRWFAEYERLSDIDVSMIERVANAEWRMRRCERQLVETEHYIGAKPLWEYTEDDEKLLQRARRYHRETVRLYTTARRDLDNMRLTRHREMTSAVHAARNLGQLPIENPADPQLTQQGVVRPATLKFSNPPNRKFGLADPLDETSGPAPSPYTAASPNPEAPDQPE